jgi:hypothetical protein
MVKRDRLSREPTDGKVLGERAQHSRTLDGLPLHFGDLGPKTGRKLCGDCASPPIGQAAAIEVPDREQRRRAGNEPADTPRTDGPLATWRQAIGGHVFEHFHRPYRHLDTIPWPLSVLLQNDGRSNGQQM